MSSEGRNRGAGFLCPPGLSWESMPLSSHEAVLGPLPGRSLKSPVRVGDPS